MTHPATVLALGAHPDDVELGCGATLAKLAAQGARVRVVVLSEGRNGCDPLAHDRGEETRLSLRMLGIEDVEQARLPDTGLPGVLPDLIALIQAHCDELRPDRVYTMFQHDRHQDHRAVFDATIVACRGAPQVLCYETPSSWPNFMPVVFEPIEATLERKIAALDLHASQRHRAYMQDDHIRCNARFRGHQVGLGPCEGFIPYRMVL